MMRRCPLFPSALLTSVRTGILAVATLSMLTLSPQGVAAEPKPESANLDVKPATVVISGILEWEADTRANFRRLVAAAPRTPADFSSAVGRVDNETGQNGFPPLGVILVFIILAGLLGEGITRRLLHRIWRKHLPLRHGVAEILPLASGVLTGGFLYFSVDWPPLTGAVLFIYLAAFVLFRFLWTILAAVRAIAIVTPFIVGRLLLSSGLLLFALATGMVADAVSISVDAGRNASIIFSVLLLFIGLEIVWRHARTSGPHMLRGKILRTAGLLVLWLLWLFGLDIVFWIMVYAVALPVLIPSVERLAKGYVAAHWPEDSDFSVPAVIIMRGLRAIVIVMAVLWLIAVWQYNSGNSNRLHALLDLAIVGVFRSIIVLLIADLGWSVAKVIINRKLASVAEGGQLSPEETAHRARLRTLLPIFRNGLAALVLVVAALTVLAQMGIKIGPLIAGAGIFGVAIGFGSQTLVKDIISGVFYLMDDAFRVGEYIQSGSYMGTVESFSLRSVRLRHHRGPIFTVPFGELGAVQNMSRDWAIDKFQLRLSFDADIAEAKKLAKKVGAQLLDDPELGPVIIETLKLKGVEQIGDFGIDVSFTFTAVPGNQSMIRRSAQAMIREAFLESGIGFAHATTVQVGGNNRPDTAVAAIPAAHPIALNSAPRELSRP
ncbi:MAG: mechanosensitive ion channel family protein [Rhizobiaceae bacterium]|nr:mechanosensitive ion channel family protein [Rhizobiaceae bacterium]